MADKRVLVVEDDEDCLEATCAVLECSGYTCVPAGNGLVALEWLRGNEPPGLILLDLMLPVMDGWQLLGEISKDARLATIPVILTSGERSLDAKARALGSAGMLAKPFEVALLLSTVARFLR